MSHLSGVCTIEETSQKNLIKKSLRLMVTCVVPDMVPIQGESAGKAISGQDKLGKSKSLSSNNLA